MNFDDDIEQAAAAWFAAQRRGPMSLEERRAFDAWRADPIHQAALNHMYEVWGEVSAVGDLGVAPRRRLLGSGVARRAAVAAVVVLSLSLGAGAWWSSSRLSTQTGIGEQRSEELADGSIVALNVVTRARYDINRRARIVHLNEGEAAFVVHKDPARPFLVLAGGYEVRAVGTAFNVRSRDQSLDIAVKEGVVLVRRLSGHDKPVRLLAGQRLQIKNTTGSVAAPLKVSSVSPSGVDEWRQRILTYEDAPVSVVMQDINRFYERPLEADPSLARRRVTLRLVIDDRADTVKRLAALLDADVRDTGKGDKLALATES